MKEKKVRLSGYRWFMDRLRTEGKLLFYCSCGVAARVDPEMPLLMKCLKPCEEYMTVMDEGDMP